MKFKRARENEDPDRENEYLGRERNEILPITDDTDVEYLLLCLRHCDFVRWTVMIATRALMSGGVKRAFSYYVEK